jgi:hypothetical protein
MEEINNDTNIVEEVDISLSNINDIINTEPVQQEEIQNLDVDSNKRKFDGQHDEQQQKKMAMTKSQIGEWFLDQIELKKAQERIMKNNEHIEKSGVDWKDQPYEFMLNYVEDMKKCREADEKINKHIDALAAVPGFKEHVDIWRDGMRNKDMSREDKQAVVAFVAASANMDESNKRQIRLLEDQIKMKDQEINGLKLLQQKPVTQTQQRVPVVSNGNQPLYSAKTQPQPQQQQKQSPPQNVGVSDANRNVVKAAPSYFNQFLSRSNRQTY